MLLLATQLAHEKQLLRLLLSLLNSLLTTLDAATGANGELEGIVLSRYIEDPLPVDEGSLLSIDASSG